MVEVHGSLMCPPFMYCIVFYSVIVVYKGIKMRSFSYDSTKFLTAIFIEYSVLMMTLED
jgi:hypothetical protein